MEIHTCFFNKLLANHFQDKIHLNVNSTHSYLKESCEPLYMVYQICKKLFSQKKKKCTKPNKVKLFNMDDYISLESKNIISLFISLSLSLSLSSILAIVKTLKTMAEMEERKR